jgi:hypothetical protein
LRRTYPLREYNRRARSGKNNAAAKQQPFDPDLKREPHGRLDRVGYPLSLKHAMRNQLAGSQSRLQIADCRLGGRPPSVLDIDDGLLGPVGEPGENHGEGPTCVLDSPLHHGPIGGELNRVIAIGRVCALIWNVIAMCFHISQSFPPPLSGAPWAHR